LSFFVFCSTSRSGCYMPSVILKFLETDLLDLLVSVCASVLWNYTNMLILAVCYHACCLHVVSTVLCSHFSVDLFLFGILSYVINYSWQSPNKR
jgi:hypothetical protein